MSFFTFSAFFCKAAQRLPLNVLQMRKHIQIDRHTRTRNECIHHFNIYPQKTWKREMIQAKDLYSTAMINLMETDRNICFVIFTWHVRLRQTCIKREKKVSDVKILIYSNKSKNKKNNTVWWFSHVDITKKQKIFSVRIDFLFKRDYAKPKEDKK